MRERLCWWIVVAIFFGSRLTLGIVLTTCTQSAFYQALNRSEPLIQFNCEGNIPISSEIWIERTTTIDGGGRVTLDGLSKSRIFILGRRNALSSGSITSEGITLILRNIHLQNGYSSIPLSAVPNPPVRPGNPPPSSTTMSVVAPTIQSVTSTVTGALTGGSGTSDVTGVITGLVTGVVTGSSSTGSSLPGTVTGALTGAVTSSLTGAVTGAVTSSLTGAATGAVTGLLTGGSSLFSSSTITTIAPNSMVVSPVNPNLYQLIPSGGCVFVGAGGSLQLDGVSFANCMTESKPEVLSTTDCPFCGISYNGGAIYLCSNTQLIAQGVVFQNNIAFEGGAIYVGKSSTVNITSSLFNINQAENGGAILIFNQAKVYIAGTTFDSNIAKRNGGGLYIGYQANSVILNSDLFINNEARATGEFGGGAFYAQETRVTVYNCQFRGNTASMGGGIHIKLTDLSVFNSIFSKNRALGDSSTGGYGGGIFASGALRGDIIGALAGGGLIKIKGSSFEENYSTGSGGGALIYTYNSVTGLLGLHRDSSVVDSCAFCSNEAPNGSGAGIVYMGESAAKNNLQNSVFSGDICKSAIGTDCSINDYTKKLSTLNNLVPESITDKPPCSYLYNGLIGYDRPVEPATEEMTLPISIPDLLAPTGGALDKVLKSTGSLLDKLESGLEVGSIFLGLCVLGCLFLLFKKCCLGGSRREEIV
eukprot:TRINITY_DN4856_c0_g1_i1.p1 TRINITY_DN4856_c0_g1~~TRINITY_DN4856_c0_g1_i1.p1  ORF type:complete len:703 (-),score=75.31 TRINITY_DN4856_c0_g1_i1:387-2495(-)